MLYDLDEKGFGFVSFFCIVLFVGGGEGQFI